MGISGSPSGTSKSRLLVEHALARLAARGAMPQLVDLAALPADTTASFAGVANPHRIAPLAPGATVVDIGCGAGMDLLLAAQAVGPRGRAIGIDMTDAMAVRARAGARIGSACTKPICWRARFSVVGFGKFRATVNRRKSSRVIGNGRPV